MIGNYQQNRDGSDCRKDRPPNRNSVLSFKHGPITVEDAIRGMEWSLIQR